MRPARSNDAASADTSSSSSRIGLGRWFRGDQTGEWDSAAIWKLLAAGCLSVVIPMVVLTFLMSEKMKASTLQSVGEEGAALISSVLGPAVQELATSPRLSPETTATLDRLLHDQLSGRVVAVKIWLRDGTLTYATDKQLVGQKFDSSELAGAFAGKVSASFDDMNHSENQFDRLRNIQLVEIYAPLYRAGTREVIAVGEIYRNGEQLASALNTLWLTAAGIVGAIAVPMTLLLFMIVRRASAIIGRHQAALTRKAHEAQELASLNDRLRQNAVEARLEAGRSNERLLAQIGQDLHDGPLQLLSLLTMKLQDGGHGRGPDRESRGSADPGSLAARILQEVRDISAGLVLPQLDGLTTVQTIDLAVRQHEFATGTKVKCDVGPLPDELPHAVKVCLFRVIQEGLNNAYRHAGGHDQRLTCSADKLHIRLTLSDGGYAGGRVDDIARGPRAGLGLLGISRRVEAIGGSFQISGQAADGGVRVTAMLPIVCDVSDPDRNRCSR